ncbi:MAG TPA: CDP-diacylglycerol--glycerol-3-phosphate 3-phosphatidyltransferase [Pseudomonadales bacterium]|nr:CDP-diacylglycerol--glycerol-3-phosphate 3-phosphatidyltransferase [Pseudomonadales bacterium]
MSIPNILTGLRILLIPVLVVVFYLPVEWRYTGAALVFTLAAITDYLDGYLARRWGQVTPFGAFLDPVADKLIVAVSLVLLVAVHANALLAVPSLVIVGREIAVSALREWMAQYSDKRGVAVSFLGKVKTVFQMVSIIVLLASGGSVDTIVARVGVVLLYAASILTLWSMYLYLKLAWPELSSGMINESAEQDEDRG